ncbi:LAQU0S21e00562g1_1 [Lachancea quebecensis]|uniref:LAQU0S21e00562g1_1 n=1 Tax=Lachancea quebecensis TaxID=1654605 RepID=A0A0N7MME5_9SACH|nr:LAQU0S21e00562g1_1 [Lachancea quebecensis]
MLDDPGVRLRNAVAVGKLLIVKRILSRFPDLINVIDPSNGWSLLHYASYYGRYLTCVHLVQLGHGKSEVLRTFKGNTCVHLALFNGHEQTAHLLLQHFPYCLNMKGHKGLTPVQMTCLHDHHQCLSLLLSLGADISLRDDNGNTALHTCLMYGSESCMRMLVLEANAEDLDKQKLGEWVPADLCQTFELAEAYQKALKEKRSRAKLSRKPSYQFAASPLTIPQPFYENTGSPLLTSSPAVQSFTSSLPPLPQISTSRRTSVGSQNVWSPRTPVMCAHSTGSVNSPSKNLKTRPSISSQMGSASSASLSHQESTLSMNSGRNKPQEQYATPKFSRPSTANMPSVGKSMSTTSITSSDNNTSKNSPLFHDAQTRPVLRAGSRSDSREASRDSVASQKLSMAPPKSAPISLLNIPISKLRNRD